MCFSRDGRTSGLYESPAGGPRDRARKCSHVGRPWILETFVSQIDTCICICSYAYIDICICVYVSLKQICESHTHTHTHTHSYMHNFYGMILLHMLRCLRYPPSRQAWYFGLLYPVGQHILGTVGIGFHVADPSSKPPVVTVKTVPRGTRVAQSVKRPTSARS